VLIELPVLQDLRMDLRPPDVRDGVATAALIADPTRAGILAMLRGGPHCVCEMAAALDERQNNVSNHLARLRDAGFVRVSRGPSDGRRVYYERDEVACAAAVAAIGEILG
jgi:DNA-binding transcriptional ArsR family regulator